MSENFRDYVEIGALCQHQRRPGVAQLMQVPVAETGPSADPGEPMRHIVRIQRGPQGARKDQVVFPPSGPDCYPLLCQTGAVAPRELDQLRCQKEGST